MNDNSNHARWLRWLATTIPLGLIGLLTLALPSAHAQAPVVSALYTQSGSIYNYNFSVQNVGLFTLADISISVPTGINAVTNLSAPTGFQILFDSDLGLVDFLADSDPLTLEDFFPGMTVSDFLISSSTLLTERPFTALDDQGTLTSGTIRVSAAPEPGTLSFFLLTPVALLLASRRRHRATTPLVKG